ncbi:trehalose-phosphatase [Pelagibacterium halotolerans]|uniref:Trehalose 6-phosphate phosphatase n=1 Tax=Pelagibacterium halotolerans (strain DSM 22347 / JCM 15775 / CGMCC 1.7692 / B2) TaxID=1082931 RepID=G4R6R6_PELHB|nr:trehalose-phosphatase [Pelagibacterium halotolerans]AEQ52228.1 trehalose-6-phosphate phosphatase [Pelagibacterium halotolerans B2]QJR18019.1 trehalose-phosphatase [Pelagibacterium halotolerans]SEA94803.1 trehalose 6-phosphatase [Pelagibacterium halotolerans]
MQNAVSAILSASSGPVAIFTDFDGTLVEIASHPDAVLVPDDLPARLRSLYAALDGALAIVTGRTIDTIDGFLPAQAFSVAGSHGAEHRHNGQRQKPDAHLVNDAETITGRVSDTLLGQEGILVEPKPTGVAVHYRAAPAKGAMVRAALSRALDGFPDFHAIDGKKVVEARPTSANKGAALSQLMQVKPFASRMPVFIGDDVTDEDGFAAAERLGGFGIRIGQDAQTHAQFSLPDIASLYSYFDALIEREPNSTASDFAGQGIQESRIR